MPHPFEDQHVAIPRAELAGPAGRSELRVSPWLVAPIFQIQVANILNLNCRILQFTYNIYIYILRINT